MTQSQLEKLLNKVQKPGRYCGGELNSVIKDKNEVRVRFAFCFPDTYEVGMSHLGMKILYSMINNMQSVWCERVFAPWEDMETEMRQNCVPLFGLESRDPIKDFDFIGFTIQYELCYTNILNMLDLAGLKCKSCDRSEFDPIIIAGGPCVCNGEPIADFIDIFCLGEGEEITVELIELYDACKQKGMKKSDFLREAAKIEGIYVPSAYTVSYNEDNTIKNIQNNEGFPKKILKRIIKDLNTVFYPESFVVPYIEIVHDRVVQEIFRGCIRGCRFCQAGFIYRPVREKSCEVINNQSKTLCDTTGYDEVSLSSLSTSDYTQLEKLLDNMLDWTDKDKVNISLPSLRIDNFSEDLARKIQSVRKSGLTFAPEAGTQRLRDVINKNVTEEEIMKTCDMTFKMGNISVKLYFMIGLPTETLEDVEAIPKLAQGIIDLYYSKYSKSRSKSLSVSMGVASFIPKPFTPFQWEPQDEIQEILIKQKHLVSNIRSNKINYSWHDAKTSLIEGVFARGDRRLGEVIYNAWAMGCKFDGWGEYFNFDKWIASFKECNIDPAFYTSRKRDFTEILPWDHLDYGILKEFLIKENLLAHSFKTTPNCRDECAGCGANSMCKEACSSGNKSMV